MELEIDSIGRLAAGTDIDAILQHSAFERELMAVWETYGHNRLVHDSLEKLRGRPDDEPSAPDSPQTVGHARQILTDMLSRYAAVTPAQALAANQRLVELLTGHRWHVMRDAREDGDTWATIGNALKMSKQGASDWYTRKIAEQQKYVPSHDDVRSRAVVDE